MVFLCMTFWLCFRSLNSAVFSSFSVQLVIRAKALCFVLAFGGPGVTTDCFSLLWGVSVIRPTTSLSFSWPRASVIQPFGLCRVGLHVCCFSTLLVLLACFSRCLQDSFKIASDQPIRFPWLQLSSVNDMASPSFPSFGMGSAASRTLGDSPIAATTIFFHFSYAGYSAASSGDRQKVICADYQLVACSGYFFDQKSCFFPYSGCSFSVHALMSQSFFRPRALTTSKTVSP